MIITGRTRISDLPAVDAAAPFVTVTVRVPRDTYREEQHVATCGQRMRSPR